VFCLRGAGFIVQGCEWGANEVRAPRAPVRACMSRRARGLHPWGAREKNAKSGEFEKAPLGNNGKFFGFFLGREDHVEPMRCCGARARAEGKAHTRTRRAPGYAETAAAAVRVAVRHLSSHQQTRLCVTDFFFPISKKILKEKITCVASAPLSTQKRGRGSVLRVRADERGYLVVVGGDATRGS
jgi:hypothetical protein